MYALGDYVVYGIHGVCRVSDLQEQTVDKKLRTYYVLEPCDQSGSKFMVPVDNPAVLAKLRPVLSKGELETLLSSTQVRQDHWIEDENKRKQTYRELITSGDRTALLQMIYTLEQHKARQAAEGRKFHLCDENFLRDATKLLEGEFSLVLGIETQKIKEYIRNYFV